MAETKNAVDYYYKLPFDIAERDVIVTDVMLATGGTIVKTIEILRKAGVKNIKVMCIITCPEGIEAVHKVKIFTDSIAGIAPLKHFVQILTVSSLKKNITV